jgi:hypothetical protein
MRPGTNPSDVLEPNSPTVEAAQQPSGEGPVAVAPSRIDSTFVAMEPFGPDTVPFEIYNSTDPKYMARLFMPAGNRRNNTNTCNTGTHPTSTSVDSFCACHPAPSKKCNLNFFKRVQVRICLLSSLHKPGRREGKRKKTDEGCPSCVYRKTSCSRVLALYPLDCS